jgi:L-aspartate oxidase
MYETYRDQRLHHWRTSVVVIGSGVAGLACALALSPIPVLLLTKTTKPQGGSSVYAQGGIAAAIGSGDSPGSHAADTVVAGAGTVDPDRALLLAREGAEVVRALIDAGVPFDRSADGDIALGREAAHSTARIVHAGGDYTGHTLVNALLERVAAMPSVRVVPECFAIDLVRNEGRVAGLVACQAQHGCVRVYANHVVLATGGIGGLWRETTNPAEATGDGLALAARAGAHLADLEFIQFHPTALLTGGYHGRMPLLTEALRGAGALLLDEVGRRFMTEEHALAELAPRDVVARSIARRIADGQSVFLDLRPALAAKGEKSFPQALMLCRRAGYDALRQPVPVAPAAHYHMGGIVTDDFGRTGVPGLWACGEVAMTGVHGANRLASNSMLEGLVFARRVAQDIRRAGPITTPVLEARWTVPTLQVPPADEAQEIRTRLRALMATHVGIVRSDRSLRSAAAGLAALQTRLEEVPETPGAELDFASLRRAGELRNMLTVARLVTLAASQRTESRGAHYRTDHPQPRAEWQRRLVLTHDDLHNGPSQTDERSLASVS